MQNQTNQIIAEKVASIQAKISLAEQARSAQTGVVKPVTLVAVSKRQSDDRIEAALKAGQRVFGENRVQEAQNRWTHLRNRHTDMTLHLIGPLQTNKVSDAVALFDVIEVVDRPKLAKALRVEMNRQERKLQCYVQVNTGEEEQKSGIFPADADDFITYCRDEERLTITGLMCIPPVNEDVAMHFALLQTIAERNDLSILSMGMSDDFEEAVAFGATSVRIGSAIFGARQG